VLGLGFSAERLVICRSIWRFPGENEFSWNALGGIKDVVRKGYVRRIDRDEIVLDRSTIDDAPGHPYVDCTAKAFGRRPSAPVFDRDRITLQPVRAWRMSFSAAVIGHVEAAYDDDAIKNHLCVPIPTPDVTADWPRVCLLTYGPGNGGRRTRRCGRGRLTGAGFATTGAAPGPEAAQIRERLKEVRPRAEANLRRLVDGLDQRQ